MENNEYYKYMILGTPIVQDPKKTVVLKVETETKKETLNKNTKKDNIALFAGELSFIHPVTKEVMDFKLDLPNRYPYNIFKN